MHKLKTFVLSLHCILLISMLMACEGAVNGEPPLHKAAYYNDVERMKKVLKSGIFVDSLNSEGATPLHWAAFKGNLDAAKLLLRHGANVNARTKKGSTPLRLATTHKQEALITLLKRRGGTIE